ncbi:zinc-ribbon domain-containing protein [Frigoribacterium sp. PhB24]|uniref:zinc-ribbon domain-containing protein n=1 Tax=Frigoribacterium sp. PhB24 TaxID=2485204 RepID=UPI000FAD2F73|nr:zinc-ribbon domain-containing protein [Frigoribacterium sp. PhB24]ROS54635.1 zinc ribbon protein [Frigoribacterium sp. PhB24]
MYCPTCASPLPVGAMFCGECGRAVSSADLAAARRRADAAAEHVDAVTAADLPEAPTRAASHPRRGDSEPPWWVRDRQPDTGGAEVGAPDAEVGSSGTEVDAPATGQHRTMTPVSVPEPPVWPVDDRSDEPEAVLPAAPEEARAESPGVPHPVGTVDGVSPADPVVHGGASRSAAPDAAEPPTPLRSPAKHADDGPRVTPAPLWTASLTPAGPDDSSPAAAGGEPSTSGGPDDRRDDESDVVGIEPSVDDQGERPAGADRAADDDGVVASASSADNASTGAADLPAVDDHDDEVAASAGPAASTRPPALVSPAAEAPRDGDTAPVAALGRDFRPPAPGETPPAPVDSGRPGPVPLVEPVPLVRPGSAAVPERCTHCGASIGEDDIFCGECGAVVQSVALSFTGPVVPLPPEWRPDDDSVLRRRAVGDDDERAGSGADDDAVGRVSSDGDDVPSRGVADDEPPAERRPAPEPIDHVPGFRAERPAVTPEPTVADVPPAPSSSSAPAWRPRRPLVELPDDDVDETRIVRRGVLGTEYVLQFSTGESITVDGTGLIGRAPTPQPGERFDQLVRIVDPGKSVSKTHLEFGQEAGILWVSDRWSGNGTVVRPRDLPPRRADPGARVRVTRGTRVEIGEQFFVVV